MAAFKGTYLSILQSIRLRVGALSVLWLGFPSASVAEEERLRAAEVNGVPVYQEQVSKERRLRFGEIDRELDGRMTNRLLLNRLVERELLYQQVSRLRFLPSREETLQELGDVKKISAQAAELGLTEEEFILRRRKDFAVERLLAQEVYRDIPITDADLRKEYEAQQDALRSVLELRLREIFFPVNSEHDERNARVQAETVRSELRGDVQQFGEYARKFSQGSAKGAGGELGYLSKNQLDPIYAEKIFTLQPSEISEVIQSENGFHIFLVVERRGGVLPKFESVSEQLRQGLLFTRRESALKSYLDSLKRASKIIIYSQ